MKKLKKITVMLLIIVLFMNYKVIAVDVTKENLEEALNNLISYSESEEYDYQFNVSDENIQITSNGKDYYLKYDLTNNPTFTLEIPIQQGMSYEDFNEQSNNIILPMFGYIAVANIQGVEFDDLSIYMMMSLLGNITDSISSEGTYIIIDDTDPSNNVVKDETNKNIIYVSEFGERVIEYVNYLFKDKQVFKDEGINSYEWTIEKIDETDTSCKIVSSLTVNLDADFSKIEDYANEFWESTLNKDITEENADYVINLKVGQKCIINSDTKIIGHFFSGTCYEYNKISDNCAEIIGTKEGKANGYLYLDNTKKSFFITVDKNDGNLLLDTITLDIENSSESGEGETDNTNNQSENNEFFLNNQNNSNNNLTDPTTAKSNLPQAGLRNNIYISFFIGICFIIAIFIKFKKH